MDPLPDTTGSITEIQVCYWIRSSIPGHTASEGVLVAVSIPIFTNQLKKANLATNQANCRAAKAAAIAAYLEDDTITGGNYNVTTGVFTKGAPTTGDVVSTTEPATWTVAANDNLASKVYKTNIGITLTNGAVTQYDLK